MIFKKWGKMTCLVDSEASVHLKVTGFILLYCSQPPEGNWTVFKLYVTGLDCSVLKGSKLQFFKMLK